MEINLITYIIILPSIFFAGLIDSIAGGGGLISVPAYLAAGLPPHFALGNNKFSSTFGTLYSMLTYHKNKFIDVKIAVISAVNALIGSFLGTKTVLFINPDFLKYILIFLIPLITVFTLIRKDVGNTNKSIDINITEKIILSILAGFIIGFYDGFFGPGTGSFLILFYTLMLKYDFVSANANTKVVNFASNIAALTAFMIGGKIIYQIALPAAVFGIAGNAVGSRFVVKKGNRLIKPVFLFVLGLLFIKMIFDAFF